MAAIGIAIAALAGLLSGADASAMESAASVPEPTTRRFAAGAVQMFEIAEQLKRRGETASAEKILAALSTDPDADVRLEARFRRSKLLQARGANVEAAVLLRQIVDNRPAAIPARLELAQLLHRMGDTDSAWRQMRAAQSAGLPRDVARLVDRYSEALRAARPYGATFEIAMAPDSNINRATRSDSLGTVIGDFEIGDDSKAKSGIGLSMRSQVYRRLAVGNGPLTLLARVSGMADSYRRSEYNDMAVELSGGPEWRFGRDQLNFELGAGQRWFGQKPFQRSARASVSFSHPFGGRTLARIVASAAKIDNRVNDLQDGKVYSAALSLERALTPTLGAIGTIAADRQDLRDPGYATTSWRAGLNLWRDLGRVTLSAGAEIGRTRADKRLLLFPDRRSDRFSKLSFGAAFRQLALGGFAPVARLTIERNRSSIAFYDYRRTRTEIGVVRAF